MERGKKRITAARLKVLTQRAGMALGPEELERLQPVFEEYVEMVRILHGADLDQEEPAGCFNAAMESTR